jgi:hypothetical protein
MNIIDKYFTEENYQATLIVDKMIVMQGLDESSGYFQASIQYPPND